MELFNFTTGVRELHWAQLVSAQVVAYDWLVTRHQPMEDAAIENGGVAAHFGREPRKVFVTHDKRPFTTRRGGPQLDTPAVEIGNEQLEGAVNVVGGGEEDVVMAVYDGSSLVKTRTWEEGPGAAHWVVHVELGVARGSTAALVGEAFEKNEATSGRHEIVSVKEFGGVARKEWKEVVGVDGRDGAGGRVD